MSWYLAGAGFPWFIFLLAPSSALILLHYWLHFHRNGKGAEYIHAAEQVGMNAIKPLGGIVNTVSTSFTNNSNNNVVEKEKCAEV